MVKSRPQFVSDIDNLYMARHVLICSSYVHPNMPHEIQLVIHIALCF